MKSERAMRGQLLLLGVAAVAALWPVGSSARTRRSPREKRRQANQLVDAIQLTGTYELTRAADGAEVGTLTVAPKKAVSIELPRPQADPPQGGFGGFGGFGGGLGMGLGVGLFFPPPPQAPWPQREFQTRVSGEFQVDGTWEFDGAKPSQNHGFSSSGTGEAMVKSYRFSDRSQTPASIKIHVFRSRSATFQQLLDFEGSATPSLSQPIPSFKGKLKLTHRVWVWFGQEKLETYVDESVIGTRQ